MVVTSADHEVPLSAVSSSNPLGRIIFFSTLF